MSHAFSLSRVCSHRVCSFALQTLYEAALAMFDEKLDTISSGLASVRQVISLLRFGFPEALGAPRTFGRDHFGHAVPSVRTVASVYGSADNLLSPHRWPRSPGRSPRPHSWRPHSQGLEPIAGRASRPTAENWARPMTQVEARRPMTQGEAGRPMTQGGEGRSMTQGGAGMRFGGLEATAPRPQSHGGLFRQSANDDAFGSNPLDLRPGADYETGYEDDEWFSDDSEPEIESFSPWGRTDVIAESVAEIPSGALPKYTPQHTRTAMRSSTSLPTLSRALPRTQVEAVPVSADGVLRVIQARLIRRMPSKAHNVLQHLDDGNKRASGSALVKALRELAADVQPPVSLPDEALAKLIAAFDHRGDGFIDLREFGLALGSGRIPSPGARRRAREPPKPKARRRKKKGVAPDVSSDAAEDFGLQTRAEYTAVRMTSLKEQQRRRGSMRSSDSMQANVKNAPDPETKEHQRKSARAAALLIASVKEKCETKGGTCNREQFTEAMIELGVIPPEGQAPDELFTSLDMDGSGIIHIDELEAAAAQLLDPAVASHLEELVQQGRSIKESVLWIREKLTDQATRVIELFKEWDTNHDGIISRSEFVEAMPYLGMQHCLPIEVTALFNEFDPDGSGTISFRELHQMLRRGGRQKTAQVTRSSSPGCFNYLVDVGKLRREIKSEVLEMGIQTEFNNLVVGMAPQMSAEEKAIQQRKEEQEAEASL